MEGSGPGPGRGRLGACRWSKCRLSPRAHSPHAQVEPALLRQGRPGLLDSSLVEGSLEPPVPPPVQPCPGPPRGKEAPDSPPLA